MLNLEEKRLCAVMVRRAGYRIDDRSIDVAISDIESGRAAIHDWSRYLADFIVMFTRKATIDQ